MGALPRRIHGGIRSSGWPGQACHPAIGDQDRLFPPLIATGDRLAQRELVCPAAGLRDVFEIGLGDRCYGEAALVVMFDQAIARNSC